MSELNEQINDVIEDAQVVTVPIDDTLTISGEEADAKAVGDALALKADKSELAQSITVNGQSADLQGAIIVDGTDIEMSGTDTRTLKAAIDSAAGRTGADIPLNAGAGAVSIEQAIANASSEGASVKDNIVSIPGEVTDDSWAAQTVKVGNVSLPVYDTEAVRSVNNVLPGKSGNVNLTTVDIARQLQGKGTQMSDMAFIRRCSGGEASIADGDAWLGIVRGNCVHNGFVPEDIALTVDVGSITAEVNETAFKTAAGTPGTYAFNYTTGWDTDPATYGITVDGTPASGDKITVVWTAAVLGEITPARPDTFVSTGWNLYNHTTGYARVVAYSEEYGYKISGAWTSLKFSQTEDGAQVAITPDDGVFNVNSDGYIWVTGGNASTTAIWAQHSEWQDSYPGSWEGYSETSIDLTDVMDDIFPTGLCSVGSVRDEINVSLQQATKRIGVIENYSAEDLADVIAMGVDYDYDDNNIYYVLEIEEVSDIELDGSYTVSDHGLEIWEGTDVPVWTQTYYGENLVDKLRTDVVTISQQTLTSGQQAQVRTNIGAVAFPYKFIEPKNVRTDTTILSNNSYAIGNLVVANIKMSIDANITTNKTLFSLPAPVNNGGLVSGSFIVRVFCTDGTNSINMTSVFLLTSGGVYNNQALTSGTNLFLNVVYLADPTSLATF